MLHMHYIYYHYYHYHYHYCYCYCYYTGWVLLHDGGRAEVGVLRARVLPSERALVRRALHAAVD
eukprot:COSAG03_NODE_25116_length_267_cov_2.113095_1_plen_63_part_01